MRRYNFLKLISRFVTTSWQFIRSVRLFKTPLQNSKGMSLLEIMVVLTIIAGVISLFVGRRDGGNAKLKESVRKIGILSRDLYYRAKLKQVTYRLVIDMAEGSDSEETHRYWVESAPKDLSFDDFSTHKEFKEQKEEAKKEEDTNSGGFEVDSSVLKRPEALPTDLIFEDVELISKDEPLKRGKAYIHFLPEGFVEEVAIHISHLESAGKWTMTFHPLTGRADIYPEYVSLKKIREVE